MIKPKAEGGLGFWDIYAFNMAMLAKQGWQILQNPKSLCARILKAKYFPTTSILMARPKTGTSYTWCNILCGIELLNKGIIGRVVSGDNLNIRTRLNKKTYHTKRRKFVASCVESCKPNLWYIG
jgi:hypothetical protein